MNDSLVIAGRAFGSRLIVGTGKYRSFQEMARAHAASGAELRRLVAGALALYGVGTIAILSRHAVLAALLYAAGIGVSALAAWLSRGSDSGGGPPPGDEPADEQPPPDPDGLPMFDWAAFEREFSAYATRHERLPVR